MNQRLKELKLQAIKLVAESYPCDIEDFTDGIDERVRAKVDEKFAELIVRECAHVALMSNGNNLHVFTLIKEHFGVEE